jgi:hypothetical protein
MRVIISVLILLSTAAYSQDIEQYPYNMGSRFDTINLATFRAAMTVSYKFDSVTMFVDLIDFRKEFDELWRTYKKEYQENTQKKRSKTKHTPALIKTWFFLDSIRYIIHTAIKKGDTLFLSQKSFRSASLSDLVNFFPYMIEENRCTILDAAGKIHLTLVKQTGGWHGQGGGFGGRRYYLIGSFCYFVEAVDWDAD